MLIGVWRTDGILSAHGWPTGLRYLRPTSPLPRCLRGTRGGRNWRYLRWEDQPRFQLARTACLALQRLSDEDKGKLINTNSRVFAALQGLVTSFSIPEKIWYGAADKAISTIYTLHPAPEIFATETAKKSLSSVFSVLGTEDVSNGDETENDASLSSVSPSKLGRFLFVISHIALNHLVYIENSVRKIQKQIRKNEKSQSTTEDLQSDVSKSSEVILA